MQVQSAFCMLPLCTLKVYNLHDRCSCIKPKCHNCVRTPDWSVPCSKVIWQITTLLTRADNGSSGSPNSDWSHESTKQGLRPMHWSDNHKRLLLLPLASQAVIDATVSTRELILLQAWLHTVAKVPLDARERSSCASSYWYPAFLYSNFIQKTPLEAHNHLSGPIADVQFRHLWYSTYNY